MMHTAFHLEGGGRRGRREEEGAAAERREEGLPNSCMKSKSNFKGQHVALFFPTTDLGSPSSTFFPAT